MGQNNKLPLPRIARIRTDKQSQQQHKGEQQQPSSCSSPEFVVVAYPREPSTRGKKAVAVRNETGHSALIW
jgi:hypothetical protein